MQKNSKQLELSLEITVDDLLAENDGKLEEKFPGEFEQINLVMDKLEALFPDSKFKLDYEYGNIQKFMIVCNNYELIIQNKKFRTWIDILRKKFPKLRYFCAYRSS